MSLRNLDRAPAALLDHDQPGAAIRGVGDPADVAQAFQLIDQYTSALLAHLRLISEVRQARTVRGDALKHRHWARVQSSNPAS